MSEFDRLFPGLRMRTETEAEIEAKMPQYLFYEPAPGGNRKKKLCKCSGCGNAGVFELTGKHGDAALCPMCMEQVTLIAHNRLRNGRSLECRIPVVWLQADGPYLWAVGARVTRRFERNSYDGPDWYSYLDIEPYEVYQFTPGVAVEWKKGYSWIEGRGWAYGWRQLVRPQEPIQRGGMYGSGPDKYYLWQTDEIEKSPVKYSGMDLYLDDVIADGEEAYGVIKYLTAYCERPKLELVVKWGLWDVANDLVWRRKTNGHAVSWNGNTPWEFLKISKADWNAYRSSAVACVELLKANRRTFRLPLPELLTIARDFGAVDRWLDKSVAICKRGVPLKQQVKYIAKQEAYSIRDWSSWLYTWLDYLDMAGKLGRDVSADGAIMPRDLQQAHDDMVALQRAMRQELEEKALAEKQQAYEQRREALEKKYAYQSGALMIRVPASAGEIIREGNVLHICVGGYAGRHMEGKTTILFLRRRRKPDTPYICIEIDKKDNRIIQIHGYKNEYLGNGRYAQDPGKKFEAFLNEWLAWVKAGSHREKKQKNQEVSA